MKFSQYLFLLIIVWICFDGCTGSTTSIGTMQEPTMIRQATPTKTPMTGLDSLILMNNYSVATSALDQAILEKNTNTIRLGLKSRFMQIKIKSTQAIAEIEDKVSIPALVETLKDNQNLMAIGTEDQVFQNQLNREIVTTLELLTDLRFNVTKRLFKDDVKKYKAISPEELQDISEKTTIWCNSRKKI